MAGKGKKGGKKKKGSADASGAPGINKGDELDELSKQFYLVQIRDLEEKLQRYQVKCDTLTLENHEYQQKYDNETKDKQEIVAYLRKLTDQKTDKIQELNEEIINMQAASDSEQVKAQARYTSLKNESTEQIDRLRAENALLAGQLASLQEFKIRKDQLEQEFTDLQAKLDQVNQNHKDTLYRIERKQVVDKDRLKREMVGRVNAVATEFRRVSNQQMAETTKRTIQENVAVNSQLVKLTDKTKDLMAENEALRAKLNEHSRKLELLEKNERELARKNHCSARIIALLTERSNELETDLGVSEEVLQETRDTMERYQNQEFGQKNLKERYQNLVEKSEQLIQNNAVLQEQFDKQSETIKKLSKVVDQCSIDLTNHMMGNNQNILPNLLSILASASTGTVKQVVQQKLGEGRDLMYANGNLSIVPK